MSKALFDLFQKGLLTFLSILNVALFTYTK